MGVGEACGTSRILQGLIAPEWSVRKRMLAVGVGGRGAMHLPSPCKYEATLAPRGGTLHGLGGSPALKAWGVVSHVLLVGFCMDMSHPPPTPRVNLESTKAIDARTYKCHVPTYIN